MVFLVNMFMDTLHKGDNDYDDDDDDDDNNNNFTIISILKFDIFHPDLAGRQTT